MSKCTRLPDSEFRIQKMEARMAKLHSLSNQREQAQDLNFEATKVEDFARRGDDGEGIRTGRQKDKLRRLKTKMDCEKQGIDYERHQALKYSIEETEAWNRKQKIKSKKADKGFSDYATMGFRKYKKLISDIKPNTEEGTESLKPDSGVLGFLDHRPSNEKVNEMVNDLEKQIQKRKSFSKRRKVREDEDVTYINERNYRFNRKIARAFDPYTEDLKQNLERGTAL